MSKVTGVIDNMNDNYNKVNILVNGTWYSTKQEYYKGPTLSTGMTVSFDDGGAKFLKYVKAEEAGAVATAAAPAVGKAPAMGGRTFPVGALAPERTINRQNALTNAVNYTKDSELTHTVDSVINIARQFEAYTTGDLDLAEVEASLKELEG